MMPSNPNEQEDPPTDSGLKPSLWEAQAQPGETVFHKTEEEDRVALLARLREGRRRVTRFQPARPSGLSRRLD
ncbi:MAG: hypothetical protein JKY65_30880 [Planctomycetes bacterium]|nr:hypothetical protein [Planctomycetota bacterium]